SAGSATGKLRRKSASAAPRPRVFPWPPFRYRFCLAFEERTVCEGRESRGRTRAAVSRRREFVLCLGGGRGRPLPERALGACPSCPGRRAAGPQDGGPQDPARQAILPARPVIPRRRPPCAATLC